jgi:hypothetical protein
MIAAAETDLKRPTKLHMVSKTEACAELDFDTDTKLYLRNRADGALNSRLASP